MNDYGHRREFLRKLLPATLGLVAAPEMIPAWSASPTTHKVPVPAGNLAHEKKLVPVMLTPYQADGRIHFDQVSRLIDFYLQAGAKGFFANCLSSEMYFMDDPERIALTRHVVKYVNGQVPVVSTGSFGTSLREKVAFAKKIQDTGADATILITSHFAQKSESDAILMENFERFFEQVGTMKLGTYECPSPYKRVLSPEVFKFLVSNPHFVYHKDTSEDLNSITAKLGVSAGTRMELYNAHTATALESLRRGAKGTSPIAANFYPEMHRWLCEQAANPAKAEEAAWLQAEMARMEPIISKMYPVSAKYFLQKRGLPIQTTCRSNTKQLLPEQRHVLDDAYQTFLGWCERLGVTPARG
ncbi:dihydrodipicolinate synthase family protein [Rhabdobacter roseus]|uniref:4-hydroxy-tetrahydrodipicolinate synthase n=1 Tax=Rhabdobacter roseus TaxID=1655419 RepID=A0A840TL34_9BACT|nr:dihydrodipicolinate synthase family protein [Rhabdobacter roseus]MBB5284896.1 4-hydroxy-tetrahydrodipicolinate synthase [Rhabdobacter roseus]